MGRDRQFPVLPQAAIQKNIHGNPWKADLDFVALDFLEKKVYLIEVKSSSSYLKASKVLERLTKANCDNIESYVNGTILKNELASFTNAWWFFVRDRHIDRMKKESLHTEYIKSGGCCDITALQNVHDQIKERLS
ncbi:hypothetical protein W02_39220 [Nitrospira sp. KM1]|uniref:hypothetical protein n=1 Tax=Nitrospira sp. KM1 TaxID=1936990 RepID=UPI0013A78135|nr:hypothetical protein [Nitrospira sp. KM1]BCA56782.1 hypothetical protein W02_39220 [Nitrospira sp. KM1]